MTPDQQLELLQSATHEGIAKYLAMRVRGERVKNGYSQVAFAEKAGVTLRTYKRFELSGGGSIETLARIVIAMEHARGFLTLFPMPQPIAQMSLTERIRVISERPSRPVDDSKT
ncbi:helix-turn-helix domain-containing protein [Paraburkholderia terricola]|uniref:helix-turn-helix domain-containing protein n=1 Tax=Paraburkholderia terricola TaxID=169427 RepID=UPI002855A3DF|nr:helix-turn-helix transcriptional regulator [Paraburkholderia terricola]MDR6482863.1 transcriptional regulator with XRE-family HTH domain [Paraburkholderia terricola]